MSWCEVAPTAPFGTTELPYGAFLRPGRTPQVGVAVGDQVLDLAAVWRAAGRDADPFEQPTLNAFLARGPTIWAETRSLLQSALANASGRELIEPYLIPMAEVELRLPVEVADYVDFYASLDHASNVGRIFRPDGEPLTPNWKHLPIGYHGRAGTVVVSGTDVARPRGQVTGGQVRDAGNDAPTFGPSRKLDFEAELGWVVGVGSTPGEPVPTKHFRDHVFGVVVLNDWSARDVQAWESVPLGPFLGKSFATSISAWVLPLAALDAARISPPEPDVPLLPYLAGAGDGYDLEVEVAINGQVVSRCPYAGMYYTPAQLMAHLTANGASLRTGDLYGSGTISGPHPGQRGSLLELSWNGTQPVDLGGAGQRTFLEDGDEVVMRAASRGPAPVRLGEVRGTVCPSRVG